MSGAGSGQEPSSELRRRRDDLAEQVAELQWNLGGLTYEMAVREHFRLDVLIGRAAMLQERDAELAEVERLLHMHESGTAGNCASCGAVRSRGAVFCWQCGARMMESTASSGRGDSPEGQSVPSSPVAGHPDLDGAAKSGRERIVAELQSHPVDMLAAASERTDLGESLPRDDLGRPLKTSS